MRIAGKIFDDPVCFIAKLQYIAKRIMQMMRRCNWGGKVITCCDCWNSSKDTSNKRVKWSGKLTQKGKAITKQVRTAKTKTNIFPRSPWFQISPIFFYDSLKLLNNFCHSRALLRILGPHALYQIHNFWTPLFSQPGNWWSLSFLAHGLVNGMLVHTLQRDSILQNMCRGKATHLPWESYIRLMPLEHLPVHTTTRENVDLMVVLRMCYPKLWRLPVNSPHKTPYHWACWLFNLCQTKIGDLGGTLRCNKNIRRLAISMNDRWLPRVQVFQAACNVQHHTQL